MYLIYIIGKSKTPLLKGSPLEGLLLLHCNSPLFAVGFEEGIFFWVQVAGG